MPAQPWIKRWGYEVTKTASTGVFKMRDGRWLLFAKVKGKPYTRILEQGSQKDAEAERLVLICEKRGTPRSSKPNFGDYATSLYERKCGVDLKSAASRARWDETLRLHLIPAFGLLPIDQVTKTVIEDWKKSQHDKVALTTYAPRTVNGWISILRVVMAEAVEEHDLPKDPMRRVEDLSTAEHDSYPEEDPNALKRDECRRFLATMRRLYPQFYAVTLLGFATGLRPSTLRPLRRRGPEVDVLWNEQAIVVRRSNSRGTEFMKATKNGKKYKVALPGSVMAELAHHVAGLKGRRAESDLLFPPMRVYGDEDEVHFLSRSALDKPFARVSRVMGLKFTLTPRGMRRTFQDIARTGGVEKNVRKAICGHETDEASNLYETVGEDEMRAAVSVVVDELLGPTPDRGVSAA